MAVKWTDDQQRVIDSRGGNLLVSAAAGSGKTAVLVERIIQMISHGEHPLSIDQLLVMTFTNAAAAEMRERIGAAIDRKLAEEPENEHLWLQAALVPQAQITTIDSFCLNLIRNHYHGLDIDPGFRIGDEGELSLLRADVMEEMLEEQYQKGEQSFLDFVEQFGRGKSDGRIEELTLQAWNFAQSHPWPMEWVAECRAEFLQEDLEQMEGAPWFRFLFYDLGLQMEELTEQMEEALEVCREENGPLAYEPMIQNDCRNLRQVKEAAAAGDYGQIYESLSSITFDRLASIRSKEVDPEKKAFVSACRDRAKKAAAKCRDLYAAQPPEEMARTVKESGRGLLALLDLVEEFDRWYTEKKRDRNVVDFNDLEHMALEILWKEEQDCPDSSDGSADHYAGGSTHPSSGGFARRSARRPSAVAEELSRQYEEILVDEYQDSNSVQEMLIKAISRERHGHPNVFMVGDVKQSIYRFRLARPELFLEKYETYGSSSPYRKIELHQNFRSRDTVLDSVNQVFFKIMTKSLGGIRYTQEAALHPGAVFVPQEGAGTPTELLMADTGNEALKALDEEAMDYTAKELEARMIAGRIRQLTDEKQGLMVWDKEKNAYRRARFSDIVILLRSLSGWSEIFVNVLMNEGIPAYAQTKTGYFNTVEVETILSLLAVIDNPIQDIPLAAVMKSPITGMTDEEMAWLAAAGKKQAANFGDRGIYGAWRMWLQGEGRDRVPDHIRPSMDEKLEKLWKLLSELRREAEYLPVHQLMEQVYDRSGYYDYVSAMSGGETRKANLDMLAEKAAAYEATSYKGLFHFIRYIEKLKRYNTDFGEASSVDEQADTVRIMSIHKSKGLEFPVVFLAGMGKRFNKQDAYAPILMDPDLGLGADWMDLDRRLRMPTLKKQAIRRRMELEAMGEELRVLYVAMTRAKEKLILTAADRSLASKLEKWENIPFNQGQVPYTILSTAGSFLDWILMSLPCAGIEAREIPISSLVSHEVRRQAVRRSAREDLLNLDLEQTYSQETKEALERELGYVYPYEGDTKLYAMLSVSELKKQGQIGQEEEEIGRARWNMHEEESPKEEKSQEEQGPAVRPAFAPGGAVRGTAYHRALELLPFERAAGASGPGGLKEILDEMTAGGLLSQEERKLVYPANLWRLVKSPLGERLARAEAEGRLHREQQFMIGIPASRLRRGNSEELVLIQGVIDAYLEEKDGLVLIDYKTDRIPEGEDAGEFLLKRYRFQVDCYRMALEQVTGKKVKEALIYSVERQEEILC